MKFNFDKEKGKEALTTLTGNAVAAGKKLTDSVKSGIGNMVEKTKADSLERKLKKLNPVFPEQYRDPDFHVPNMIRIVDDAVRRGEQLCEGAIGWLGTAGEVEVLFLYDEAVKDSGLCFVPAAVCDGIYYVDSYDRNRFIQVDCIFSKAHEERLAELKHIAHSLGAEFCSVEIVESKRDAQTKTKSIEVTERYRGASSAEKMEQSETSRSFEERRGKVTAAFSGSDKPKMPQLKWFQHDDSIKRLIEMRFDKNNVCKQETLELSGTSCSAMSLKTAYSVDAALVAMGGAKAGKFCASETNRECGSILVYHIKF